MTLDNWIKIWLETYKKPFINAATMDLINYCIVHIKREFRNRRMSDIKGYEIQQFHNSLGDIPNMQEKVHNYLNDILEYAFRNRIIEYNPMSAVKVKKHYTENTIPMTIEERNYFLESIKGKPFELLYLTYLCTGARKSEILFDSIDIDLNNNIVHLKGTKNNYSDRYIPLFDKLKNNISLVSDYKQYYASYTPNYTYLQFRRHCQRIGLNNFCVRSLRSTFSNMCFAAGVREKTLQSWLGHSGRTTLNKYYLNSSMISQSKSGQIAKEIELVNSIL